MEPTLNPQGQTQAPDLEAVRAEERRRISEIQRVGAAARMSADAIAAAVDNNTSVQAFREQAFDAMLANASTHETRVGVHVTRDQADTRRELIGSAVMNRVNPAQNRVEDANPFRHMSCLRMAEESLVQAGVSVRGKTPSDIAIMAMQQTSDFPYVLENTARKMLMAGYDYAQPTYKAWTKASTTPDFKTMSRTRLGEAPKFLTVAEGAQIAIATMSESREQYAITTAGRGVSFTRQMMINDDLGAFNSILSAFGTQAAIYENKTVYAILTANAAMADGTALFHADHSNLGSGVIANTALDAMFTSFATQTGIDAVSVLNLNPRFLIVPAAKRATAETAMTAVGPSVKIADQNWFAGRLTVVADAELDGTSTVVWYAACDPNANPGIEYSYLEGASGPQVIREENSNGILGINLYAYLDFGAKAVDWRPLYKSTGA